MSIALPSLRLLAADVSHLSRVLTGVVAFEALKRRPLLDLVQHFEPRPPRRPASAPDTDRLVRLTQGALRRIYRRDFCLPQSLILYRSLAARGLRPRLLTGVRREADRLVGHAWIDVGGRPLAEPADPRDAYRTTFSYPSSPSAG
jgi:hypothetical protein